VNLSGHTVLITGTGTGMGLEAAKHFAARGNRVVMVARNEERLRREADRVDGAVAHACDISDADHVAGLFAFIAQEHPNRLETGQ
jgi:uncharacterized oxidoreductase